jgi:hypothetical protein
MPINSYYSLLVNVDIKPAEGNKVLIFGGTPNVNRQSSAHL